MARVPLDLRPAVYAWCGLVGGALVIDVWLIRAGKATLSAAAATTIGRVARGVLEAHFEGLLGPVDPFRVIQGVSRVLP